MTNETDQSENVVARPDRDRPHMDRIKSPAANDRAFPVDDPVTGLLSLTCGYSRLKRPPPRVGVAAGIKETQ